MTKRAIYFIILCILSLGVGAQQLPLNWRNTPAGCTVYCLYRDAAGIQWLGTADGLMLFDGSNVWPVGRNVLQETQVNSITEGKGGLLLGTNDGLFEYDYADGRVKAVNTELREIRALLPDGDCLWVGTLQGLWKYGPEGKVSERLIEEPVYALLRTAKGKLYAGTVGGLYEYAPKSGVWSKVKAPNGDRLFVNALVETKSGLLVGTEGHLYKYNSAWEEIPALTGNVIKSLAVGIDETIIVGTDDGVVELERGGALAPRRHTHDTRQISSIEGNEIWCLQYRPEEGIMVGHERGLSQASRTSPFTVTRLSDLTGSGEGHQIYTILRDRQGTLWLGGTNGVIAVSPTGTQWYKQGTLSHSRMRDIHQDREGGVWLATDGGLNCYDQMTGTFNTVHVTDSTGHVCDWVYSIVEDGNYLIVGTFLGGIHIINKYDRTDVRNIPVSNNLVKQLALTPDGTVWAILFRDRKVYSAVGPPQTPPQGEGLTQSGATPEALCVDKKGNLWCAYEGGVRRSGGADISYASGLDERTLAMAPVGEGIWVSTATGVRQITADGRVRLLPVPQKSYTAIYDDTVTGRVLLGCQDELIAVNPDIADMMPARIAFVASQNPDSTLTIVDPSEGLRLPNHSSLSLIVSTLDYGPESIHRYSYKLASNPTDTVGGWVMLPQGATRIDLSSLKWGSYSLLIKAVGAPSTLAVPIHVRAPWYLQWWAWVVYAILLIGLVVWLLWLSHRRSERKFQEEERRQQLESAQRKLDFMANVLAELKVPVSMIMGPVKLLRDRLKDVPDRRTLDTVHANVEKLSELIHEFLEVDSLDGADEAALMERLSKMRQEIKQDLKIGVAPEEPEQLPESLSEKQLTKIAKTVEDNIADPDLNVNLLCELTGIPSKQLYRLVKKYVGVAPLEYIRNVRLERAATLLRGHRFTVSEVCYMVGFKTPSYFAKCFRDRFGVAPAQYEG